MQLEMPLGKGTTPGGKRIELKVLDVLLARRGEGWKGAHTENGEVLPSTSCSFLVSFRSGD